MAWLISSAIAPGNHRWTRMDTDKYRFNRLPEAWQEGDCFLAIACLSVVIFDHLWYNIISHCRQQESMPWR